jgi:hypothetical protein
MGIAEILLLVALLVYLVGDDPAPMERERPLDCSAGPE